jgi:hypothetical protein
MDNVITKVEGDTLTITIDLTHPGALSKSQKTTLVASTHGSLAITYAKRSGITLSLNVMAPK